MAQIETVSQLADHYGEPTFLAARKNLDRIDVHARAFIARSPFIVLSTADADGWPDASPRGDAPGFVTVEDSRRLLVPDRPGNNRVDSFHNVMSNPKVGILFLLPGHPHSLRVNGSARLLTDEELCERFSVNGKSARAVLEVTPSKVFFHCGKSLIRSRLWDPAQWPGALVCPTLALHSLIRSARSTLPPPRPWWRRVSRSGSTKRSTEPRGFRPKRPGPPCRPSAPTRPAPPPARGRVLVRAGR